MANSATIRLAVCAFAVFSLCVAVAKETKLTIEPDIMTLREKLDAMPPQVFQRMLERGRLVGSPGLTWDKSVLTVAIKGGSEELNQLIEQTANEWTASGGRLSFSFKDDAGHYRLWTTEDTTPAADIRIGFDKSGYWSLLGMLSTRADANEETMNYEKFPEELKEFYGGQNADGWRVSYFRRTILHEFGHALGLSHEHYNPQCQIDLDMPAVVKYLMGPPNNWSEEMAKFSMDAQYFAEKMTEAAGDAFALFNRPAIDQKSVMLYVLSPKFFKSGNNSVCNAIGDHKQPWSTELSEGDKQFYLANYGIGHSPLGGAGAQPKVNPEAAPELQ